MIIFLTTIQFKKRSNKFIIEYKLNLNNEKMIIFCKINLFHDA